MTSSFEFDRMPIAGQPEQPSEAEIMATAEAHNAKVTAGTNAVEFFSQFTYRNEKGFLVFRNGQGLTPEIATYYSDAIDHAVELGIDASAFSVSELELDSSRYYLGMIAEVVKTQN